jgi:hypothetical protein
MFRAAFLHIIRSSWTYISIGTFYADLMTVCYQEQDGTAVPIFKGKYGEARLSRNVGKELPLPAARREQFSRHIVIFLDFVKELDLRNTE